MAGLAHLLYFSLSAIISAFFAQHADEPYMDEVFHIPQAQKYFNGNFSYWDPKITTPPGNDSDFQKSVYNTFLFMHKIT